VLVDPAHEFPRTSTLVGNLLSLKVEKDPFSDFDHFLEAFPVFEFS